MFPMKPWIAAAGVFVLIAVAVLAYGYWFAATHGALYISVMDVSERERPRPVAPVELSLLDGEGRLLARAAGIEPSGAIYLTAPESYACHGVEERAPFSAPAREEWDRCFARQSRWVPTWIGSLRFVTVRAGGCTIDRLPVAVVEYGDTWWLWWVPLVHVGGKPYTSFSVSIQIDCRAALRRDGGYGGNGFSHGGTEKRRNGDDRGHRARPPLDAIRAGADNSSSLFVSVAPL